MTTANIRQPVTSYSHLIETVAVSHFIFMPPPPILWATRVIMFLKRLSNWAWPSVLWRCWLGGRKGIRPVKREWWGAGMVIYLQRGADLHMAQLMPLPLTVSCFNKIQIGFTFLVPAHPGSPGQRAVKRMCVCVSNWAVVLFIVIIFVNVPINSRNFLVSFHIGWIRSIKSYGWIRLVRWLDWTNIVCRYWWKHCPLPGTHTHTKIYSTISLVYSLPVPHKTT